VAKNSVSILRTSKNEDDLPHLVSMFFDDQLCEADCEKFQQRLQTDPSARRFYTQYAVMQSHIMLYFNHGLDIEASSGKDLIVRKRSFLPRSRSAKLYSTAIAFILLLAVGVLGWNHFFSTDTSDDSALFEFPQIAIIERSESAKWEDQQERPVTTMLNESERLSLLEGEIEIRFRSGTTSIIQGPCDFQLHENDIALSLGKLVLDVSKKAVGFSVATPAGKVIDLGTSFSVSVTPEKKTEIQVFRGKVKAFKLDSEGQELDSRILSANQAAQFEYDSPEIEEALFASLNFLNLISRDYPITDFSKDVNLQETIPDAVASGLFDQYESNNEVFVFPEKQNVLLKADLQAAITQPGTYQNQSEISQGHDIVREGTRVDSLRIYFNPIGHPSELTSIEGKIHFQQPVVGILTSNEQLLDSSPQFSSLLVDSPSRLTIAHSNASEKINAEHQDVIQLSPDRRVLSYKFSTFGKYVDDLRVLVKSKP